MRTVYFDYNATTPLDPEVRNAMLPFLTETWGNPSSIHRLGRQARALLDEARERGARALGCKPSELIFTSGGTESANLAILGTARALKDQGRHLVVSSLEHHAVLHCCDYLVRKEGFEISRIPVSPEGQLDMSALVAALRPDTILVSVMAANNEIGTIQPVSEIGALCRERGILFHTDAVQAFGKVPIADVHQFAADLVSICAHKMHGPKGAGALFVRSPLHPDPILFGGGHENERRAGTENLAAIMGLVVCLEKFVAHPVFAEAQLRPLTERLWGKLQTIQGVRVVGSPTTRLPNTVAFVTDGADSISLLAGLDMEGICASSGSACSAGSLEPSHVVTALGLSPELANSLVRFSLGRESSLAEVEYVQSVLPTVIARARAT